MMKTVHFGAGRIGMGLIAPVFCECGELVLVDRKSAHVARLNREGYRLIEADNQRQSVRHIRDFRAIGYADLEHETGIDVITTAVIEKNLPDIVPSIQRLLQTHAGRTIYIIPMENSFSAVELLRSGLEKAGADLAHACFLRSVIDKIVPGFNEAGDVLSEPYASVRIENRDGVDALLPASLLADDIEYEFEKKFIIVNGLHAAAAYLGYANGFEYIDEIACDPVMQDKLVNIGHCYAAYLASKYDLPAGGLEADVGRTIGRFQNRSIHDHVSRVGRNLMIKLSLDGRIMRPLRYNRQHGLPCRALQEVVAAARTFDLAVDYEAFLRSDLNRELERYL